MYIKSDAGKFIMAGPPEEGWIIASDNPGWWERWEIRRCSRDTGDFVYLIKSLAHGHYLRTLADGAVSISRKIAGPEEEFTLDNNIEDETSAMTFFKSWDGKYLTVSPSGGVRAVRKYYAQHFGFEPVPAATLEADKIAVKQK